MTDSNQTDLSALQSTAAVARKAGFLVAKLEGRFAAVFVDAGLILFRVTYSTTTVLR